MLVGDDVDEKDDDLAGAAPRLAGGVDKSLHNRADTPGSQQRFALHVLGRQAAEKVGPLVCATPVGYPTLCELETPNGRTLHRGRLFRVNDDLSSTVPLDAGDDSTRTAQLEAQLVERGRELEELHERLTRHLVQFAHVNELERRRIAAEIHDTAVQKIAAALLLMDLGGEDNLARVRAHLEEAVRAARELMGSIHPPLLEEVGVAAAVRGELERLASRPCRPLQVTFADEMEGVDLDTATELIVWRAVSDTLRSSWLDPTTTTISVTISYDGSAVQCNVTDDGTTSRDADHPTGAPSPLGTARGTAEAAGGRLESHQGAFGMSVSLRVPKLNLKA